MRNALGSIQWLSDPRLYSAFFRKTGCPSDPSPPSASVCEAYRESIEQGFARGRNDKAIWQDLVSDMVLRAAIIGSAWACCKRLQLLIA